MTKVALYGNLVLDLCLHSKELMLGSSNEADTLNYNIGGVGNLIGPLRDELVSIQSVIGDDFAGQYILRQLHDYPARILITNQPTPVSIILEDSTKTSIVKWGASLSMLYKNDAIWHHISYLDRLPNLPVSELQTLPGIVSADLCRSTYSILELANLLPKLKYLDILFLSDLEAKQLCKTEELELAVKQLGFLVRGFCVLHCPDGFYLASRTHFVKKLTNVKSYSRVLGAGDKFAAYFIKYVRALEWDEVKHACEVAQDHVQTYLGKINEEI